MFESRLILIAALGCLSLGGCAKLAPTDSESGAATSSEEAAVGTGAESAVVPPSSAVDTTAPIGPASIAPVGQADEPSLTETASGLVAAAQQNATGQSDLAGKVVQVSGAIDRIWLESDGTAFVSIASDDSNTKSLKCATEDPQPWLLYSPGQTVTVKGRCVLHPGDAPELRRSIVVQSGEPTIEVITAPQLAANFAFDTENAMMSYVNRFVILVGNCSGAMAAGNFAVSNVAVEGHEGIDVQCLLGKGDVYAAMANTARLGQPVRVLGRVASFDAEGKSIVLDGCLLLPSATASQ